MASTAESLTRALRRKAEETVWLTLGPLSDLPALKRAVQTHAPKAVTLGAKWILGWSGSTGTTYESSEELIDLIATIGKLHQVRIIVYRLPLQSGDTVKLVKALLAGNASYLRIDFHDLAPGGNEKDVENEVLETLVEISHWEQLRVRLHLTLPISLEPKCKILSTLAEVLPKVTLTEVKLFLKEPSGYDVSDQEFVKDLERAIQKIQIGLEKNYTLEQLFIGLASPIGQSFTELRELLEKLMEEKIHPLLKLNQLGRGYYESLPLHLATWLEIVARHQLYLCSLDATFYYLRKNTWMFTPEIDLVAQNRRLCGQVKKCKREINMEIQALEKRHKAELKEEKKCHQIKLEAKDAEIQELQAQLSRAKTGWCVVS